MVISDEMNEAQEQLISLIHYFNARDIFSSSSLPQVWCNVMVQHPDIAHFPLKLLVPFPSTYICETAIFFITDDEIENSESARC